MACPLLSVSWGAELGKGHVLELFLGFAKLGFSRFELCLHVFHKILIELINLSHGIEQDVVDLNVLNDKVGGW